MVNVQNEMLVPTHKNVCFVIKQTIQKTASHICIVCQTLVNSTVRSIMLITNCIGTTDLQNVNQNKFSLVSSV